MMRAKLPSSLAAARWQPKPYVRSISTRPQPACPRALASFPWSFQRPGHLTQATKRADSPLGQEKRAAAIAQMIEQLNSPDSALQLVAAKRLCGVYFKERLPSDLAGKVLCRTGQLQRALMDSNWDIRAHIVQVFASLEQSENCRDRGLITPYMSDDSISVMVDMLKSLEGMTVDELQTVYKRLGFDVRVPATYLLSELAKEKAAAVIGAGGIPVVVKLLDLGSDGGMVPIHSARTLQCLAMDSPASQETIVTEGAVDKLLALLHHRDIQLQATAADTLCFLAVRNKAVTAELEAAGVLHMLPASLRPDPASKEHTEPQALPALAEQPVGATAQMEEWKHHISQAVKKLNSSDITTSCVAAMELTSIAHHPDMLRALTPYMVQSGAIAALLQALGGSSWLAKGASALCLQSLAVSYPGILSYVSAKQVVPWLVVLLKDHQGATDKELLALVISQISDISLHYPAAVAEAGAIPLLVGLLNGDGKGAAKRTVSRWSEPCLGLGKGRSEGVHKEQGRVDVVCVHTLAALRNLAQGSSEYQDTILAEGAIPKLSTMMSGFDTYLHTPSIEVLGSLAQHNEHAQKEMEQDGDYDSAPSTYQSLASEYDRINPVYQALSHLLMLWDMGDLPGTVGRPWKPGQHDYYVSENAVDYKGGEGEGEGEGMAEGVGDGSGQEDGVDDYDNDTNLAVELAKQLYSSNESTQQAAARQLAKEGWRLRCMTKHTVKSGILQGLLDALRSSQLDIKISALLRLAELLRKPFLVGSALPGEEVLPVLIALLQHVGEMTDKECCERTGSKNRADVQFAALKVMIVLHRKHSTAISEAGAIPLIVPLLDVKDRGVRNVAAGMLRRLAMDSTANQDAIVEAGAIPKLSVMLGDDRAAYIHDQRERNDKELQAAAAEALYALALNNTCIRDMMQADGLLEGWIRKFNEVSKAHRAVLQAVMAWGIVPPPKSEWW